MNNNNSEEASVSVWISTIKEMFRQVSLLIDQIQTVQSELVIARTERAALIITVTEQQKRI